MTWLRYAAALGFAAASAPCLAESAPELSANAAVVSDYRYRGVSLSDRNPAIQGGLDLESEHLFVGTLASTISDYGGSETELDIYAGVRGGSDTVSWYAGAFYYLYPGGADVSYAEIIASAEATVGLVTFGAQVAYAPPQDNLGSGNKYLAASAAFDTGSGFGLLARGGYEDGWFFDRKWDWELGANYTRGPFTASLSYVDTDYDAADEEGRLARAGLAASLLAEF